MTPRKLIMNERSVPALNGGNVAIVAHNAHRCGIEEEETSILGSKSKPPRPEASQKVSMGEQRHVAVYCSHLFYDTIDPGLNLIRTFTSRTTICKNHP